MNKLPLPKRVQIINLLVEGSSLRATSRIADVSINTVTKLLVDVGRACEKFHDETVQNVVSQRIQCDEIWSFVYSKERNKPNDEEGFGDCWTWTALDADTKLMISWYAGRRDAIAAQDFIGDLASRLNLQNGKIQFTTDAFPLYVKAVEDHLGAAVDFAQLHKIYGKGDSRNTEKKYSPPECIGTTKRVVWGNPDQEHISTSHVERQNLTMRMHMRRFTRLTNAFSKKLENHCHAIALHFVYYNFVKQHKTLRVTPAMAAGLTKTFMSLEDIVNLVS